MEPLLKRIRTNDGIRGLRVSGSEIKLSAYADDLTVILDGSETSLRNVVSVFDDFSVATGLKLNVGKTVCTWIGGERHSGTQICPELNLKWLEKGEPLYLLGVKIFEEVKRTREVNYESKIEEIEKAMSPWTQRSLTPLGRVILVKYLLLSKFVHLFAVIENPEKSYMARLESLLFKFIWGKKDKIKRGVAKKKFLEGGIGAPDVEAFANALKVTWIRRWLEPTYSSWKLLVNERFKVTDRLNVFQCLMGDIQIRNRQLPRFWEQMLIAWTQIQQPNNDVGGYLAEPLFLNRVLNIEASLSASQIRAMDAQNIVFVRDLYNFQSRRWFTAAELKQKWSFLNIMTCNSLVSKIPIAWRTLKRRTDPSLGLTSTITILEFVDNSTKWAYSALLAPKLIEQCSCQIKWNVEIGKVPDWKKLTNTLIACTKNIEVRWFQFRVWHRILPTRKMLKIFKIIDNDQCVFCQQAVETALHLIIHCRKVREFWGQIWGVFKRANIAYQNTALTDDKLLFGFETGGDYDLNLFFLLLAKWFLWKQSKSEGGLNIHLFLLHLSSYQRVQACVYRMKGESQEFEKLWKATARAMDVLACV